MEEAEGDVEAALDFLEDGGENARGAGVGGLFALLEALQGFEPGPDPDADLLLDLGDGLRVGVELEGADLEEGLIVFFVLYIYCFDFSQYGCGVSA